MNKIAYLWLAVKTVLCTCQSDSKINGFEKVKSHYTITRTGTLSNPANESSGLARGKDSNTFWTHNDSGGKAELYEVDAAGKLLSVKKIDGAQNNDWEDLAQEEDGTIYIGDFGNNNNDRRMLEIYKVPPGTSVAQKISFSYADQKVFLQSPNKGNYDCEAFFYDKSKLYLFSKNVGTKNHYVRLYQLPTEQGNYAISPMDSISIETPVTSADISPDGKTFALLTYGKILLFGIKNGEINFKQPLGCFRIVKKQLEALVFLNNTDMLITNEQREIFRITHD